MVNVVFSTDQTEGGTLIDQGGFLPEDRMHLSSLDQGTLGFTRETLYDWVLLVYGGNRAEGGSVSSVFDFNVRSRIHVIQPVDSHLTIDLTLNYPKSQLL